MTNEQAIEILKNIKEWFQDEGLQYDVKALVKGIEALENQKTLKEELEKIKAELLDESYHIPEDDDFDSGKIIVEWEDIYRIFNKHISELKGE